MQTAIAVTSADLVLPPTDPHTPTAALLPAPAEQSLDAALVDMQLLLEQHGHVVALYPASLPDAHQRRLHTVRSVLESDRIALLKLALPPLAVAVLVRQLRQLSICDFGPGVVACAARLLAHYVHAGAVLHSVARLDRVPVSLTSHARSWVPGSQFAVLANPVPQLIRIGGGVRDAGEAVGLEGPQFGHHLVVARGQSPSDWPTARLAPAWQSAAVLEAALPAESTRWWATAKLVEFAAYLPDIGMIHQLVSSVRRERCTWCGLEIIGDRCCFCAAPLLPGSAGRDRPVPGREPAGTGARELSPAAARGLPGRAPRTLPGRAPRALPRSVDGGG